MAKIQLPDVAEVVEAIRSGVERRLGKKRPLFTGEDLVEDVGLTAEQFEELVTELEHTFNVEFDPDTIEQLTAVGALMVRLLHLHSRDFEGEEIFEEVA